MPNPASRRVKTPPLEDLLSVDEALTALGCSRRTLYRLAAEGHLAVYKVGTRRNRYSRAEIQGLVTAGRTGGRSVRNSRLDAEAVAS